MGSDQSSQGGSRRKGKNSKRTHSSDQDNNDFRKNKLSPRPSVCSDSDIPYVSYTTTRPISEDVSSSDWKFKWSSSSSSSDKPRTRDKIINREKRDNKAKSVGSIITVKPATEIPTVENDPLFLRLEEIPPFTPIIRERPGVPWTRNPEITEKIDPLSLLSIVSLYQERLLRHETLLKDHQDTLSLQVQDLDTQVYHITMILHNREKTFSNFVDQLSTIPDLTKGLSGCHYALNKTIEVIETLNNTLCIEDRLEPFVWTTG